MKALKKITLIILLLNVSFLFAQQGKYNLITSQTMNPSTAISVSDVVEITLTVEHPNFSSCDSWMNGVILDLGAGFDALSVNYISSPSAKWISALNAADMPVGSIGWGFDDSSNGNPFSSWGESGAGPYVFVLKVTVLSITNLSDLDVNVSYYGDFDTGAYSGGSCGSVNNPDGPYLLAPISVLPIELLSFNGNKDGRVNVLNWATAVEINNDYFIVEKSYNADTFFEVAVVLGAGNSNNILHYELIDDSPKNITYYRLTQVDFNGKFEIFDVIAVKNTNQQEEKELLYTTNVNGQIVAGDYMGIVIEHYSDNTNNKKIQMQK
jgi:hypothetical protein